MNGGRVIQEVLVDINVGHLTRTPSTLEPGLESWVLQNWLELERLNVERQLVDVCRSLRGVQKEVTTDGVSGLEPVETVAVQICGDGTKSAVWRKLKIIHS